MSISLKEPKKKVVGYNTLETSEERKEKEKDDDVIEIYLEEFSNPHSHFGDGAFRAAILGFSDGMVSNLLLVLGVQFALEEADGEVAASIVTTGFSGLIASSFSMGIGEWISMKNQSEALKAEIITEGEHLDKYWEEESNEFLRILDSMKISLETQKLIERDLKNAPRDKVIEFHLKMELGIDIDDTGNPEKAAFFSGLFVAIGSFVPVLPYTFLQHDIAWIVALCLAVVGGAGLGIGTGRISGINICKTSTRQVLGIAIAAGIALLLNYYLVSLVK